MKNQGYKVTTKVIVKNNDNKLLLLKNKEFAKHNIMWDLPGGTLEIDEQIDNCVVRELYEEIGWKINFNDLQLFDVFIVNRTKKQSLLIVTYLLSISSNETIQLSDEHSLYTYVDKEEIEQIRTNSAIFKIIDSYYKKFT